MMNNTKIPNRAVNVDPDRHSGDKTLTMCAMNSIKIPYNTVSVDSDWPSGDQT